MATQAAAEEEFPLGTRVVDADGFKATVVYVGPVATAKNAEDVWLGVIWDNPSRGKHDGSVVDNEGKVHRYFSCAQNAGSFVKPSKISKGRSFVEALRERYVEMDAELIAPENVLPGAVVNTSKGTKQIEFIGETNIRKWQQIPKLSRVSMRHDTVSYAGTDIADVASHFQEVDLQDTLIVDWKEIASIASQLPELVSLHLNGNGLRPLDEEQIAAFPPECFRNLKALVLGSCKISTWRTLQLLEPHLPQLEELYLACNPLFADTEEITVTGFSKLRVLDLTETGISRWEQIAAFASLRSLQELRLDSNPLESCQALLSQPNGDFGALEQLSLSSTRLSSWLDVDALRSIESLRSLRLTHIPLFQGKGASEVRPLVVARIPQLQFLNGSSISQKERTDSEKNYLRRALRDLQAGKRPALEGEEVKSEDEVRQVYQLFDLYAQKYGTEMGAASSAAGSVPMAAEMLTVTLQSMAAASVTVPDVQKNLPGSLAVAKLKLMLSKIFGLEPSRQALSLFAPGEDLPTPLDDDAQSLLYFGVASGCTICMNEVS